MGVTTTILSIVLATILNTGTVPERSVKETACLTEAIFFEAGSRPVKEKEAVANVIMNRLESGRYPDSICGITQQKGQFQYVKQKFDKKKFNSPLYEKNMVESALVALRALGPSFKDNTGGATHFVNLTITTDRNWLSGMRQVAKIGPHTFYIERKPTSWEPKARPSSASSSTS